MRITSRAWLGILSLGPVLIGCGPKGPIGSSKAAIAAFPAEVEAEVTSLISSAMFEPAQTITWTGPPTTGMQEGSNALDFPESRGARVLRNGTLSNGGKFWAEGYYSYAESRFNSITVVVSFTEKQIPPKTKFNVPISEELLEKANVHPSLIAELLKGKGKGSLSGSGSRDFQATASYKGKRFEATTAVTRGEPLALELSCSYLKP